MRRRSACPRRGEGRGLIERYDAFIRYYFHVLGDIYGKLPRLARSSLRIHYM